MTTADRINALLEAGLGLSPEAVAAIVDVDAATVIAYLTDPTAALPSGGGAPGELTARWDFGNLSDGSFMPPQSPAAPNIIVAIVVFIGDGATAVNCYGKIRTPDGNTVMNVADALWGTLAAGEVRRSTLTFVCPAGYSYGFQLDSDATTSLASVYEQPLA